MKPILILKTGSTFDDLKHEFGDFEDWVIAASGEAPGLFQVADGFEEPLPDLAHCSGLIITGSHLMVSDGGEQVDLWAKVVCSAVGRGLPLLGICYGHQLIGHALGGLADYHPAGLELGQVQVRMTAAAKDDPLFSALPSEFPAYATHQQSLLELPPDAVCYGASSHEAHHAVRFADRAWGVQFHPEFDRPIIRAYIRRQRPRLASDEQMHELLEAVQPLPDAGLVLRRFCQLLG